MVIDTSAVTIASDSDGNAAIAPVPWSITVTGTDINISTLTIYTANTSISLDFQVTNVDNNDITQIVDTGNGLLYHDDGGSFAVIVTPSPDDTVSSVASIDSITIESFDTSVSISKTAILLNSDDGSYYALFTFDELDAEGLYTFRVLASRTDINSLSFTRQLSTTYKVSDVSVNLICSEQEANGYRFFIDETGFCDIYIYRRDSTTQDTFDISATVYTGSSNGIELTLSSRLVTFGIGELSAQLLLSVDILDDNTIGELFFIIVRATSQSDSAMYNLDIDGQFSIRQNRCPVLCRDNPCPANQGAVSVNLVILKKIMITIVRAVTIILVMNVLFAKIFMVVLSAQTHTV